MPEIENLIDQVRNYSKLVVADDYELTVQRLLCEGHRFRNGKTVRKDAETSFWISLRLSNRKQPGRASTVFQGKDSIQRLVESAFLSSERSKPDPWFRFPIWKAIPETPVQQEDPKCDSLFSKLGTSPEFFDENYEHWDIETQIVRKTEKLQRKHRREIHSGQMALLTKAEHGSFWLREERAQSTALADREKWLEELLRESESLKESVVCATIGPAMIVFSPRVVAALLKKMAPWFYADSFQDGISPFNQSAPAFSPAVSLMDDGKLSQGVQSAPFDLEGSPTQTTTLVEKGRLKSLLFDTYAATRDNRLSTGNFGRLSASTSTSPGITHSNFSIQPSKRTLKSLISDMADGYLLENLDSLEGGMRTETEVLLVGSGWKIFGSTAEPVRNIRLAVDLTQLFGHAVAVADNLAFYGAFGSPSILFRNLPIGS